MAAPKKVLVLGAGFAGLELATTLSETHGEGVAVTVIDKSEAFMFGFSKLDVLFGKATAESAWLPYRDFVKPGVTFRRESVQSIDPAARRVVTNAGTHILTPLLDQEGPPHRGQECPFLRVERRNLSVCWRASENAFF